MTTDLFHPRPGQVVYATNTPGETPKKAQRCLVVPCRRGSFCPSYHHFWALRDFDGCLQYHRCDNHVKWAVDPDFWSLAWGDQP